MKTGYVCSPGSFVGWPLSYILALHLQQRCGADEVEIAPFNLCGGVSHHSECVSLSKPVGRSELLL